jgi:glutathione synthase/RimK-type ligase-like ATP-grasp enzyme
MALATDGEFKDLFFDDEPLLAALLARGVEAVPAVWDDPGRDWSAFDLVVIRSTWDYTERRDAYVAWARSVPRLANPASVVEWNTDKTYLRRLAEAGVPVVPTRWATEATSLEALADGWDDVVVKPHVSAGARDTLRCAPGSAEGQALLDAIVASGRTVMVQPYLDSVEGYGERSLVFVEGTFSHAVRRNPALSTDGFTRYDAARVEPTDTELELAAKVLAAAGEPLLYARVDVVPMPDGEPVLIELEATEPQLFLRFREEAAELLADAAVARAGSAGSSTTTDS